MGMALMSVLSDAFRSSTIDFALPVEATAMDRLAAPTKIKNLKGGRLEKKDGAAANVIWRFLELRGYVSLFPPRNFTKLLVSSTRMYIRFSRNVQFQFDDGKIQEPHFWRSGRASVAD